MEKIWDLYKDLCIRMLYKNKYLDGRGLTATQKADIMYKFKQYVDRIDQSPLGKSFREEESSIALKEKFDELFNVKWKNHIKHNYRDIPYYFTDYLMFLAFVRISMDKMEKGEDVCWPNGDPFDLDDLWFNLRKRHNHIKLSINGEEKVYKGINALIQVCRYLGYDMVSKINLTTNGRKLLVRHVPYGKSGFYTDTGDGWFVCTSCETRVKVRLIKIIAEHCHEDIRATLV